MEKIIKKIIFIHGGKLEAGLVNYVLALLSVYGIELLYPIALRARTV